MATENKKSAWGKFMHWYESYNGKIVVNAIYSLGASVVIIGALFKIMHFEGAGPMLMVGMGIEAFLFAIGSLDRPHADYHWDNVFPQLLEFGAAPERLEVAENAAKPSLQGGVVSNGAVAEAPAAKKANVPALTDADMEALKGGIKELADTASQLSELGKVATISTKLGEKMEVASAAADKFVSSQANLADATAALGTAYNTVATDMQSVVANTKNLNQNVETAGQKISALNAIYELQINTVQAQAESYKAQAAQISQLSAEVQKIQAASAEAAKNSAAYEAATKQLAQQVADLNKVYGNMLNALA